MKDFIRKLLSLLHKQWLARNFMKRHNTQGAVALETKKEFVREMDRLINQGPQNIKDHKRWMLDLDVVDSAQMSTPEIQYKTFELEAAKVTKSGCGED